MLHQLELGESQLLAQHSIESRSLEHIRYLKKHYEKNYYVAKARGKHVLRIHISKLNRLIFSLQAKEGTANY